MVFDIYEKLKIDGKEYKLCYPIEQIARLESELRSGNLLLTVVNMQNPDVLISVGDFYALFKYALLGGGDAAEEDIPELFRYAKCEIVQAIVSALQKSGAVGKPKKVKAAKA
jgi:hypothetical protein